jgi:hypothetical protein
LFVKNEAVFVCVSSSEGPVIEGLKWVRFPKRCDYTDYIYMEKNNWDACMFNPKRDILFMGFGLLGNFNGHDMTYIVNWKIGDEEFSEDHEISYSNDELDPEKKSFTVDIRTLG